MLEPFSKVGMIGRKSRRGGRAGDSRSLLIEHEVAANRRKHLDHQIWEALLNHSFVVQPHSPVTSPEFAEIEFFLLEPHSHAPLCRELSRHRADFTTGTV
jgi:hypothetical protein